MSYDLARIQTEVKETCRKAGIVCAIPIQLNNRLTRTLGRVHIQAHNDVYFPTLVEFSTHFIETSTDESIREVILHETAHIIATERTGENCGHNATFKKICAEIGTTNDKTTFDAERTKDNTYKYEIFCPTCNKIISTYSRMCKTIKDIDACFCKTCGKGGLRVIQNW